MLKTSMSDYEKSSVVTYPFYYINRQSIHKTNCMQRIRKIVMWEVFLAIALKLNHPKTLYDQQHIKSLTAKIKSLHANNKGPDQTALPSTQPGQHICHSFSVKYILYFIHTSKINV